MLLKKCSFFLKKRNGVLNGVLKKKKCSLKKCYLKKCYADLKKKTNDFHNLFFFCLTFFKEHLETCFHSFLFVIKRHDKMLQHLGKKKLSSTRKDSVVEKGTDQFFFL